MGVKLKNFENNKYFFENTGILTVQNIGIKDFAQRKLPCKDFNDCIISVRGTNQTNGEVLKNPLLYMNSNAHIWHICLCMVPLTCNSYIYEYVPLNIVKGYIHLRIILWNYQFILQFLSNSAGNLETSSIGYNFNHQNSHLKISPHFFH